MSTALHSPALLALLAVAACTPDGTSTDDPDPSNTGWLTPLPDTAQTACYSADDAIPCPADGEAFYGQDGSYAGYTPAYVVGDDGTTSDGITGLVWQTEQLDDVLYDDAEDICAALDLGGRDWRVPTLHESYTLIRFDGATGTGDPMGGLPDDAVPYIDDAAFDFAYGDTTTGRYIDVQFISTTLYVDTAFSDDAGLEPGEECFFGVNLADGRIKCYPTAPRGSYQLRCVSGAEHYGTHDYEDLGDDTLADHHTGLQWMRQDSGSLGVGDLGDGTMDWEQALDFCNALELGGHDDWRLPDAHELQNIADYTRSPDTTGSAAIDPLFDATPIVNEAGDDDFAAYWTGTTHLDGMNPHASAVYVAFGQALGEMPGTTTGQTLFLDVHGAGAQRSDPKAGARADYPQTLGPQGDVQRVFNMARCVRSM